MHDRHQAHNTDTNTGIYMRKHTHIGTQRSNLRSIERVAFLLLRLYSCFVSCYCGVIYLAVRFIILFCCMSVYVVVVFVGRWTGIRAFLSISRTYIILILLIEYVCVCISLSMCVCVRVVRGLLLLVAVGRCACVKLVLLPSSTTWPIETNTKLKRIQVIIQLHWSKSRFFFVFVFFFGLPLPLSLSWNACSMDGAFSSLRVLDKETHHDHFTPFLYFFFCLLLQLLDFSFVSVNSILFFV